LQTFDFLLAAGLFAGPAGRKHSLTAVAFADQLKLPVFLFVRKAGKGVTAGTIMFHKERKPPVILEAPFLSDSPGRHKGKDCQVRPWLWRFRVRSNCRLSSLQRVVVAPRPRPGEDLIEIYWMKNAVTGIGYFFMGLD
jgi:hypothetical protein